MIRNTCRAYVLGASVALAPICAFSDANAQIIDKLEAAAQADEQFDRSLRQIKQLLGQTGLERTLKSYLVQFHRVAESGVLTAESFQRFELRNNAEARARSVVTYLSLDLSGDGVLSDEERALAVPASRPDADMMFVLGDTNNDGQIDIGEMLMYVSDQVKNPRVSRRPNVNNFVHYDLDMDGSVTSEELISAFRAINDAL